MLMMLPFEAPTVFETLPRAHFRMPRVIRDQRARFENDDLFRQLSHESAVKYTGFKDRPLEERQMKFITNCQEGHTEVSVVQSGSQFTLMFNPTLNPAHYNEGCDFEKELGKVHIKAGFILNGVCVLWRGWVDLQRLEGFGCLEFDEYQAYLEESMAKQQSTCNSGSSATTQTPPGGRFSHLGMAPPPPSTFNPATAAAAVAAIIPNNMLPAPPLGFNPGYLGPAGNLLGPPSSVPMGLAPPPPPPPVSLADSAAAAHYGNAALAAAAAAAFHQVLSVGTSTGGGGGPPMPNGAHHHLPLMAPPHLPYTNGTSHHIIPPTTTSTAAAAATSTTTTQQQQRNNSPLSAAASHTSPQHHLNFLNSNNGTQSITSTNGTSAPLAALPPSNIPIMQQNHQATTRSPDQREDTNTHNSNSDSQNLSRRTGTKRAPEEQSDDVDVVSDINVHDLDFPPRRIFKSDTISSHHHHQNHHQHHHKVSRRA